MKVFIDGSGWNGKTSRFSVVNELGVMKIGEFGDNRTNNEMEYEALLWALRREEKCVIFSDSQLVVNQVNGLWKVKEPRLFPLCQEAKKLLAEKFCTLKWIPRKQNIAGHLLEK